MGKNSQAVVNKLATSAAEQLFHTMMGSAIKMRGVKVERAAFLTEALGKHLTPVELAEAIAKSPAEAGITSRVLSKVANSEIRRETARVTAISTVAGMPGGLAVVGTIPADAIQFFAHVLRIAQKLAYLYGWPDFFEATGGKELREDSRHILTLLVGVMFGADEAEDVVGKVSGYLSDRALNGMPRAAFTKGMIYPVAKRVAVMVGSKFSESTVVKGVSKAIPILGGIVSGGMTFTAYRKMSYRLKDHLARNAAS